MADINKMVTLVLQSPLHFFASKNILLITFTGRRTSKQYMTPVRYYRDNSGKVVIFVRRTSVWWKNLQDCPDVTLRLKGRNIRGVVEQVVCDETEIAKGLTTKYPHMSEDKIAEISAKRVMMKIAA